MRQTTSESGKSCWATKGDRQETGRKRAGSSSRRRLIAAAAALTLLPLLALLPRETDAAQSARLTAEDEKHLQRVEDYLNRITSMQARFVQVNPDGSAWQGNVYLQRPGRLRFEYDPPVPHLLVANKTWFIHVDKELKETNVFPLSRTPASLFVRERLSFGDDVTVTGFRNGDGVVQVSMVDAGSPDIGEVTLTFTDRPLELRQWVVRDAQDSLTRVTLQNARYGVELDPKLFRYVEDGRKFEAE